MCGIGSEEDGQIKFGKESPNKSLYIRILYLKVLTCKVSNIAIIEKKKKTG